MKKFLFMLVVSLLLILSFTLIAQAAAATAQFDPTASYAFDLTGRWTCNDGGTYYLRQLGNEVFWYGEYSPINPGWSNVARGKILNSTLFLEWADVPKGSNMGTGLLMLKIVSNNRLERVDLSGGGFGGSIWSR